LPLPAIKPRLLGRPARSLVHISTDIGWGKKKKKKVWRTCTQTPAPYYPHISVSKFSDNYRIGLRFARLNDSEKLNLMDVEKNSSGLLLKYYNGICLKGLRKTIKTLIQDSLCPTERPNIYSSLSARMIQTRSFRFLANLSNLEGIK
jgi:hypothetical protein